MGDPKSTSGYLAPATYIFATEGIDPKYCFKSVMIANHEANATAVAGRKVDVATFNSDEMERLAAAKPGLVKQLRVIWEFAAAPARSAGVAQGFDPL